MNTVLGGIAGCALAVAIVMVVPAGPVFGALLGFGLTYIGLSLGRLADR